MTPAATFLSFWNTWGRLLALGLTTGLFLLAEAFPTFPGDQWTLTHLQNIRTDWLTAAANGLSYLGWTPVASALSLAAIAALGISHRRIETLTALAAALFILVGIALKELVDRPRPQVFLGLANTGFDSFPSGHTLFATILLGLTIMFVTTWVRDPLRRRTLQGVLALLILAVGLSRVYLELHWPSDVLGGYWYGGVALTELAWLRQRLTLQQDSS